MVFGRNAAGGIERILPPTGSNRVARQVGGIGSLELRIDRYEIAVLVRAGQGN
jgi:hypothetical protein